MTPAGGCDTLTPTAKRTQDTGQHHRYRDAPEKILQAAHWTPRDHNGDDPPGKEQQETNASTGLFGQAVNRPWGRVGWLRAADSHQHKGLELSYQFLKERL